MELLSSPEVFWHSLPDDASTCEIKIKFKLIENSVNILKYCAITWKTHNCTKFQSSTTSKNDWKKSDYRIPSLQNMKEVKINKRL